MCPVHNAVCVSGGRSGGGCGWRIYECSRCGGCYQCEHEALYIDGKWSWLCRDGVRREVIAEDCGCNGKPRTFKPMKIGLTSFAAPVTKAPWE